MAEHNWHRVREIFDSALPLGPDARQRYVIEACGRDKLLLAEVTSLLSSFENADSFLETPAVAEIAETLSGDSRRLSGGDRLGHYEVIEHLATGGMGEVYLAKDLKLGRRVALKILNENFSQYGSNLTRFTQEAKAASALNHPNILVIHEIGTSDELHYIVSEFVKGTTLRCVLQKSPLTLREILEIAIQVANALVAAHEANLVHRDIKPENIMVRPDGYVKILDFGIAKLVEQKNKSIIGFSEAVTRENQTAKGLILGTVNYMSPEQAKGERVDERTDIFSFGVLLYEMLTGRTPFASESALETLANLITADPQPPSRLVSGVPDELESIVLRMLRNDKDERYQTMHDVLADLKELADGLSFADKLKRTASTDPESASTVGLARTGDTSRKTIETQQTFFRRKDPRWLVAVTLFSVLIAATAYVAYRNWNVDPLPSVQDLYLQGRFYGVRENRPDNDKAIQLLEQAVAIDPNHALAHAELARVYGYRYFFFAPTEKQWQEKAYVELEKAFALVPDLPEAHEVRGDLLWMPANRFPHEQAIAAYRRALALNPNLDEAHHKLGKIYYHLGLFDESMAELRKALELNPGNTMARYRIGVVLHHQGQFEKALLALKSSREDFNPAIVGRQVAWTLISLGRRDEAAMLVTEMLEKYPTDEGGQYTSFKALLSAFSGDAKRAESEIREALEKGRGFGHFHHTAHVIACAYAVMNRPDEAVRFLQMAADDGYPCYPLFASDPHFYNIRQDPKFQSFLAAQKQEWEYYRSLAR